MFSVKVFVSSACGIVVGLLLFAGIAWAAEIFTIDKDGTVRLAVTDTGKIGIGTSSPASLTHIYKGGLLVDAGDNLASRQASFNLLTLGDGQTNIGAATTKGWQIVARGDGYAGATAQNDLVAYFWNGSAWIPSQWWDNTGNVGICTGASPAASAKLEIGGTDGAILIPRLSTAQRDALTAANGMIVYNTSTNAFNFYENGAWVTK